MTILDRLIQLTYSLNDSKTEMKENFDTFSDHLHEKIEEILDIMIEVQDIHRRYYTWLQRLEERNTIPREYLRPISILLKDSGEIEKKMSAIENPLLPFMEIEEDDTD